MKLKEVFYKVFIPFRMFIKGIKFLWKEHHFLVPPILWKKYFKRLIQKIRLVFNMEYYNPFEQNEYLDWMKMNFTLRVPL